MYIILGVTNKDNLVHRQAYDNYEKALNFMSYLQGNGVGFMLDKSFPSAYPTYIKASELLTEKKVTKQTLNKLIELEIKQNINATRILLSK